ncbi:hypothetical protein ACVILI_006803 [Mesorhizobium sp. USDA 4775]
MAIGPEVLNCSQQLKMAEQLQAQRAEAGGINYVAS